MLYFFSSDATPRYKQNVLDVLCYPIGHMFRFRYQAKHVAKSIRDWGETESEIRKALKRLGLRGVSIYAETTAIGGERGFNFYPIRRVEVVRIRVEGSVYYADVRLGTFVNYYKQGREKAQSELTRLQEALGRVKYHPLPALLEREGQGKSGRTWVSADSNPVTYREGMTETSQGYFLDSLQERAAKDEKEGGSRVGPEFPTDAKNPGSAWESVVEVLSQSISMRSCVFYRVSGFYRIRRDWYRSVRRELSLSPISNTWSTRYPLPMGSNVTMRLVFYRSEKADNSILTKGVKLKISTAGEAFSGVSQDEIPLLSRYNEEQVELACKRVLDSVLAPIRIYLGAPTPAPDGVLAAHPFLLARIVVPKMVIATILAGLIAAPVLLTVGPDLVDSIGSSRFLQTRMKDFGDWLVANKLNVSLLAKAAAAGVTLIAGFLGLRRLPLGK